MDVFEVLREEEVRPANLFARYLELVSTDIERYFVGDDRHAMSCPLCAIPGVRVFAKSGFNYVECTKCGSLWVSPRPTFTSLSDFYASSESARYWANEFSSAVEGARREKLWRPKSKRVLELAFANEDRHRPFASLIDVGGGTGVFGQIISEESGWQVCVVEPSPEAAASARAKNLIVIEAFLESVVKEQLPPGPSVFTCFELFEHVHDPRAWFRTIASLMSKGDLLVLTTLCSTGCDIQVLWDKSPAVSPPHHLNFLSFNAVGLLAVDVGLSTLSVFTPGQLDIDILANNSSAITDRFWKQVVSLPAPQRAQWQQCLSQSNLSSHLWLVATKV